MIRHHHVGREATRPSTSASLSLSPLPHRDLGGGVYERTDAGRRVGLIHVGAEPAHALVLTRLDAGIKVVRMEFVDPDG